MKARKCKYCGRTDREVNLVQASGGPYDWKCSNRSACREYQRVEGRMLRDRLPDFPRQTEQPSMWRKVTYPEAWKPEVPGMVLIGRYLGTQTAKGRDYSTYTAFLIKESGGEQVFKLSGTVIESLILASGIEAGNTVRVEWLGWVPCGNPADDISYKNYALYVMEPTS